jgi:transcriptional regulator with XRE-family HTH domain
MRCHYRLKVVRLDPSHNKVSRIANFPVPLRVHLFARRTRLGLSVKEMATMFKIKDATYKAWEEDQVTPSVKWSPSIIRFLTYSPYDPQLSLADRLVLSRSVNGITQKKLARLMDIDQSTLARWERGDGLPYPILRQRIPTTRTSLGELALRLFIDRSSDNYCPDASQPVISRASTQNLMKIPKLEVGTIEIRFSPALFVFYDARWPINKKLQVWRTSLGLSQRDFAKLAGFFPDTIRRWEKGRRLPSDDNLVRIQSRLTKIIDHLEL